MSDLTKRLIFVCFILIIYRLGVHIPIPLVDVSKVINLFSEDRSNVLGLLNLFSGGALAKVTIFSLGIMPYISSSIIIQLLTVVWPPLKKIRKTGESGRIKILSYTRYLTLFISFCQAAIMSKFIIKSTVLIGNIYVPYFIIIITLIAGTFFLIWLGEQINENGIGNGISLIICISIVSNLPRSLAASLEKIRLGEINMFFIFIFVIIILGLIWFIVFIENAQRKILIQYTKRQKGRRMYALQNTYLPFKINIAGVIPPIFASSLILLPVTLIQFFNYSFDNIFFYNLVNLLTPGSVLYILFFGIFVILFSFFYTEVIFNAKDTANNLKKSGGFITGIRPGEQTAKYIKKVVNRLTFIGAFYLIIVCLLPEVLMLFGDTSFYFGGISLLIVIVVIIDFISQVQTKLISQKYEILMKKYRI